MAVLLCTMGNERWAHDKAKKGGKQIICVCIFMLKRHIRQTLKLDKSETKTAETFKIRGFVKSAARLKNTS
ncbi:hypothetical protein A7P95_06185 [Eikenella longinqua]|uniref:Uncharacterized protein n=1 Tax=Eikenella longinqua TaxID=1795827 RepID=A0A1A9RY73_9NEIS|nr:hypothetical protein A7P95_06185 [Eikenella longinqua]